MIRDARPDEVAALEALQRRASDVWEEYRDQLAEHPDAIALDIALVRAGRVRVFEKDRLGVGFSVLLPAREGACELDGLFVEPAAMRGGVGSALVAERDGPFGDYSQAPPERRPDPSHVIEP